MLRVVPFLMEFNMGRITNKLHPMYGQEFDNDRCSGRTTVIALKAISAAITSPNVDTEWSDHAGGTARSLSSTMFHLIKCMRLQFFYVAIEGNTVYVRCERNAK